jgi:hypothetical protein
MNPLRTLLIFSRKDCFSSIENTFLKSSSIVKLHAHFKKIESSFKLEHFFPEYLLKIHSNIHNFHSPSDKSAILYHVSEQNQSIFFSKKNNIIKPVTVEQSIVSDDELLMFIDESVIRVSKFFQLNENQEAMIFHSLENFALFLKNSNDTKISFICSGKDCIRRFDSHFLLKNIAGGEVLMFPEHLQFVLKAKFFNLNLFIKLFYWNQIINSNYHDFLSLLDVKIMEIFYKIPFYIRALLSIFLWTPYSLLSAFAFVFDMVTQKQRRLKVNKVSIRKYLIKHECKMEFYKKFPLFLHLIVRENHDNLNLLFDSNKIVL